MPFGLRNAGATFQRAMQACLGTQRGHNIEAYIDDIVVKTRFQDSLAQDLHETFDNFAGSTSSSTPASACSGSRPASCWVS